MTNLVFCPIYYHHVVVLKSITRRLNSVLQWFQSQTVQGVEDVRFESASLLAEIIIEECDTGVYHQPVTHNSPPPTYNDAKQILLKALEGSGQSSAYWHCRLLFQVWLHFTTTSLAGFIFINILVWFFRPLLFHDSKHVTINPVIYVEVYYLYFTTTS